MRDKTKRRSADRNAIVKTTVEAPDVVVGRLEIDSHRASVEPILSNIKFHIPVSRERGYQDGDIVVVKVAKRDQREYHGKIQRRIRGESTADLAANVALAALRRPVHWSDELRELRFPTSVSAEDRAGRSDIREMPLVTIDGDSAKDYDDAVYAETLKRGSTRLVVAIADVAHYVPINSAIDLEARHRGCSIYLPDRVIPMLPKELSNGICSLVPDQDRLAVICDMVIDSDGRLKETKFYEAVIRSHARLTYTEIDAFLKGKPLHKTELVKRSLRALQRLCKTLISHRRARGALDFDIPHIQLPLSQGEPILPKLVDRNLAHLMIEEAMIIANKAVAECLQDRGHPLFRVHEPPKQESILRLREILRDQNVPLPARITEPRILRDAVSHLDVNKTNQRFWHLQIIQAMQLATYSVQNNGHFGLALSHYLHFTSPIRRYPDLHNHRLLKESLRNRRLKAHLSDVEQLARTQSELEREVERVTRKVESWLLCTLLRSHLGETVSGTITGLTSFGVFIELDKYLTSGLLHVSNLGKDYFELIGNRLVGEQTRTTFTVGQRLKVQVISVDPVMGRVDLLWRDGSPSVSKRRGSK